VFEPTLIVRQSTAAPSASTNVGFDASKPAAAV
jgi:hypothetical protein